MSASAVERSRFGHDDQAVPAAASACWLAAVAALGGLVLAVLWFPLLRATAAPAIAYNEGWNTYWQNTAASGAGLFVAPPDLTIENYPPLSFHLIGWLGGLTGDANMTGRAVALLSLLGVCVLAGMIVHRVSGLWVAGVYAALCPLAWIGMFSPDRIAMNDPQWLGMIIEMLGFYIAVRCPDRLAACAALFALAVFTKQNLVAFPLAVGAAMLVDRRGKALLVWASVGLSMAGLLFGLAVLMDGGFFLDHLLRPRSADFATGCDTVIGYCILFGPVLVLATILCWRQQTDPRRRLLALAWITANALGMVLAFGHGVAKNILFEAMIANAIITPLACLDLFGGHPAFGSAKPGGVLMLLLVAVLPAMLVPGTLIYGFQAAKGLTRAAADFDAGVSQLRSVQGPVWCEDLLLCQAAGHPMVFDAYFTQDQIQTGRLPECDVLRRLAAQEPAAIEIGAPSDNDPVRPEARLRFTAGFMRTLLTYYAPISRTHDFTVLAPAFGPWLEQGPCR